MRRVLVTILLLSSALFAQMPMGGVTVSPAAGGGGNSDTFTGSNGGSLAANWASPPTYLLSNAKTSGSNTARCNAFTQCGGYYSVSSADTSQMVVKAQASGTQIVKHTSVRMGSSELGYSARFATVSGANYTQVLVYKSGATFIGNVGTGTWAWASDHTVKIVASGTSTVTLQVYVDGSLIGSTTDSTSPITSGHPGFFIDGSSTATVSETQVGPWQDH